MLNLKVENVLTHFARAKYASANVSTPDQLCTLQAQCEITVNLGTGPLEMI